jgi:NADH:ubiquinone oxidoreductase subunit 3 (subunit A)
MSSVIIFILYWIGCFMMYALLVHTRSVGHNNIFTVLLYMVTWPVGFVVWCLKGHKDE